MTFAKCLLVALALWLPAASFAVAVGADSRVEYTQPCAEPETSESEENEVSLTSSAAAPAPAFEPEFDHDSHRSLDGHIVELLIPPPNPSLPR